MPVYMRASDLQKKDFLTATELATHYEDPRERVLSDEDVVLGRATGMGSLMNNPFIKNRIKESISLEHKQPDWFVTSPEEMKGDLTTVARTGGQWAYNFLSGLGDIFKGLHPDYAKEQKLMQLNDLMKLYVAEDNPGKKQDIAMQIKAISPLAFNKFTAWTSHLLQTAMLAFGATHVAKSGKMLSGIKGSYKGTGSVKDAFRTGFQAQLATMGLGFSLKQIDNLVEDKPGTEKFKNAFLEMANDPFGTIIVGGMVHGLIKGKGRARDRVEDAAEANGEVSELVAQKKAIEDFTRDETPIKTETTEAPPELLNEIAGLRNEVNEMANGMSKKITDTYGASEVFDNVTAKIRDVVDETTNPTILRAIKQMIAEDGVELGKLADTYGSKKAAQNYLNEKYQHGALRYIIDENKPAFGKIVEHVVSDAKKEVARAEKWFPEETRADHIKIMKDKMKQHEIILKKLYEEYKTNPNKNLYDFIETLEQVRKDISSDISGRSAKSVEQIYKPFNSMSGKAVADIISMAEEGVIPKKTSAKKIITQADKTRLKQLGYTEDMIKKLRPEEAEVILEGSIVPGGFTEAVKEYAKKRVESREGVAGPGLGLRDMFREYFDELENFWALRINDLKVLPKKTQKLLKRAVADEVRKAATGKITEQEMLEKIPKMIDKFLKNELNIWGLDKDTWNKYAEMIERGEITSKELSRVMEVLASHKLLAQPMIKMAGGAEMPAVFRAISAIKKYVIDGEEGWVNMAPRLRNAKMKETLKDIRETFTDDLKAEFDKMVEKLDSELRKEQEGYTKRFFEMEKQKFEVMWGKSAQEMKKIDLKDKKQYMGFVRQIHELQKTSENPLEATLRDYLKDGLDGVMNSSETVIKKWIKTQAEVLDALGLGVINKLKNASEYHFREKKEAHLSQIQKLEKQIKKWRKRGHPTLGKLDVSASKIWDWLDVKKEGGQAIELNPIEQRIANQLRAVTDYYAQFKDMYPGFDAVRDYIRHDVLEVYHNTNMLLKNNLIAGWWEGFRKAEAAFEEAVASKKSGKTLEKVKERYSFYTETAEGFKNEIKDALNKGYEKGEIQELTYKNAVRELEASEGRIENTSENLIRALQSTKEAPYWVRNRIAAGLDFKADMTNKYAKTILEEAGFDLKPYRTLEPMAVMYQILREMQGYKGGKAEAKIPSFWDKQTLVEWVRELNFIRPEKSTEMLNKLIQYDRFQKSFEIVALGEMKVLDPSIIKRTPNQLGYKSGDIIGQMKNYLNMTHRGIVWSPIAKIFNTIEPEIARSNKKIGTYLENLIIDVMGRETKFDEYIRGMITQGSIPIASELFVRYHARKKGIKNPEVYKSGETLFVKGDVFDPVTQRFVRDVEGIPATEIIPRKIGSKIIGGLKIANYWATLGMSPRAGLVNLTQPLLALAKEQDTVAGIIPTYKSIVQTGRAYANAISMLMSYKGKQRLRRAGVLEEVNRMAFEGLLTETETTGAFGKFNDTMMKIMTATEHFNRTALYEYFRLRQGDSLKAAGMHSKMIDTLAKDWSDTYNFRFDALSQPQGIRSEFGKIVFHLGTFAYHQARVLTKEFGALSKQLPAYSRSTKTAFGKLGKGDTKGFMESFDQMNNTERIGLIRWAMATYMLTQAMNATLGFQFNSVLANRSVDFYIGDGTLPEMIKNIHGIMVMDNPKDRFKDVVRSLTPGAVQFKRLMNWRDSGDWRYFLANSAEIRGGKDAFFGK